LSSAHPAATHHLPFFVTAPGETDVLMNVTAVILLAAVVGFGLIFLRLHSMPERIAHGRHKLQFEIVAVLGLVSLFTHMHIFWLIGLLLALIDLPDFTTPLNRIAGSAEKVAGLKPNEGAFTAEVDTSAEPDMVDGEAAPRDGVVVMPAKPSAATAKHKDAVHA
jgi:hypothetical protein